MRSESLVGSGYKPLHVIIFKLLNEAKVIILFCLEALEACLYSLSYLCAQNCRNVQKCQPIQGFYLR